MLIPSSSPFTLPSSSNNIRLTHMSLIANSTYQIPNQENNLDPNIYKMMMKSSESANYGNATNEKISEIVIYFAKQFEALRNIYGI